jgi:hypothetical protein
MADDDPFAKAGKWKVPAPGHKPDSEPESDVTRVRPAQPADDATRIAPARGPAGEEVTAVRPAQPADNATRARPAQAPVDDVTRVAPALPADEITRLDTRASAPAEELTRIAEPVQPAPPPAQRQRHLSWRAIALLGVLLAIAVYLLAGR